MLIWDIIRDFFVRYIFGGFDSLGDMYPIMLGNSYGSGGSGEEGYILIRGEEFFVKIPNTYNDGIATIENYLTLSDYLSTTATIIVMVLLCFLLVKLAIWIFKLGANLIRLR